MLHGYPGTLHHPPQMLHLLLRCTSGGIRMRVDGVSEGRRRIVLERKRTAPGRHGCMLRSRASSGRQAFVRFVGSHTHSHTTTGHTHPWRVQAHDSFAHAPPFNVRRSDFPDLDGISEEPGSSSTSGASVGGKGGLRQRRKQDAAPRAASGDQQASHGGQHALLNKAQSLAGKSSFLDYFVLREPSPLIVLRPMAYFPSHLCHLVCTTLSMPPHLCRVTVCCSVILSVWLL